MKTKRFHKKSKNRSKRNTKQNMKQITGGGYDDTFLECYEENLKKVKTAINEYSGKHNINKKQADQFIENQLTHARKQAARDLVENTIYITLREIADAVKELVREAYSQFKEEDDIYLYTGPKGKSFYFLSVLALRYIRKHGLKEPVKFISKFTNELFDEIGESPIIVLDDVAYSGSQLSEMMNNIFYDRVVRNNKSPPNIHILVIALNTFSKNRLSRVPKTKSREFVLTWQPSPFKLIYSEERLFKPLILKLGIQRYFNLNLFFSPYTMYTPYIALYLDYKIADEASTYKNVLFYGPIVPHDYDYNKFLEAQDYLYDIFPMKDLFDEGQYDELFEKFNEEYETSFKKNDYRLIKKMLDNLTEIDTFATSKFYPFINNCNNNEKLLEILGDEDVQNLDYSLFIAPEGCIEGNKDCVTSDENSLEYLKMVMKEKSLEKSKVIETSNKIYSYNCPLTWYKSGELKLDC